MSRYLDPKSDLVFKKIFVGHPHLLKSFLNAVLPLPEDGLIVSLEYLPSEQVPVIPTFKYTVVDVQCTDEKGRVFIVEMQMQWTATFMQRMLFNASKAYVKQLEDGEDYHLLKPVYGLGLINAKFDPNPEDWYHHYKIVNVQKPNVEIKDLQLVFIELPKFEAKKYTEKKLQVLWLRFLSELNARTEEVAPELLKIPEIKKAVKLAEEAAYTRAELAADDKYWDMVRVERTLMGDSHREGKQEGELIGLQKGELIGLQKAKQIMARKLLAQKLPLEKIAEITELSLEEIQKLA